MRGATGLLQRLGDCMAAAAARRRLPWSRFSRRGHACYAFTIKAKSKWCIEEKKFFFPEGSRLFEMEKREVYFSSSECHNKHLFPQLRFQVKRIPAIHHGRSRQLLKHVVFAIDKRVSRQSQICRSVCCRSVDVWLFSNSKIDRSTDLAFLCTIFICQSVDLFLVFVNFQIVQILFPPVSALPKESKRSVQRW